MKFNILVQKIYSVGFLLLQLIHVLALSPQVTVYSAWILAKHIQVLVWSQDSLSYGMELGWCRLHCQPFSGAQLLELWHRVLEALLHVPVTHEGYLVESRRPLAQFGSSQANRSVFIKQLH